MSRTDEFIKGAALYEGKAKIVYATDNKDYYIQYFKDDATAFNAKKTGTIADKGVCNNKIAATLFEYLESKGVETHFIKVISDREMVVQRLEIIPVEVTMRNIVAGGMSRMLGIEEGVRLTEPVLEYHYKSDELDDPLFNEYHIRALELATDEEMRIIRERSFEVNRCLQAYFNERGITLVDFKLEFGRNPKGKIILGDEISPDTCRFWDKASGEKLDKDRFRRDLGGVEEAYHEVYRRVVGA